MNEASPPSLFSVTGKTAVVTGGSRGIGYMIAHGLVTAGARVYISARKAEACDAAAAELSTIGECVSVPADLSSPDGIETLSAAVNDGGNGLDILINNAGASWGAPLSEYPDAAWDKLLSINLKGPFRLTVALLPLLEASASAADPARIVNIGSIDGIRVPALESYAYSSSKAAVHMLTRHLAKALAPRHVTVNAIAPGPFESKMMAFALDDPDMRALIEDEVPLGRIGSPADMAGTAIFLCSRAGAYLTGTVIPVDGGVSGLA